MTLSEKLTISSAAKDLQPLTSTYIDCPFCEGGMSKDKKTLGVTLSENYDVLFYCFRVGCQARGCLRTNRDHPTTLERPPTPALRIDPVYTKELRPFTEKELRDFVDRYSITPASTWRVAKEVHWAYEIYMPLCGPKGQTWGYALKSSDTKANYFTTKEGAEHRVHFSSSIVRNNGCLLIVEDVISARAMDPFAPTMALLGTTIKDKAIRMLIHWGIKEIALFLDPDTWEDHISGPKIEKMYKKLLPFFNRVFCIHAFKDPKDLDIKTRSDIARNYLNYKD